MLRAVGSCNQSSRSHFPDFTGMFNKWFQRFASAELILLRVIALFISVCIDD